MSREPIRIRRIFQTKVMRPLLLWEIRRRFHRLCPGYGQVAHALRTLSPVAGRVLLLSAAPRLACVKPAASVHPEPGSNSSLYIFILTQSVLTLYQFPKKSTLSILSFSVLACTLFLSVFSMIFSSFGVKKSAFRLTARPSLAIGIAKVITFLETANFLKKFFQKILRSNDVKELFQSPRFRKGTQR